MRKRKKKSGVRKGRRVFGALQIKAVGAVNGWRDEDERKKKSTMAER